MATIEEQRLHEARENKKPWRKWGPYLSERQWGTVREDYSSNGDAWHYFPHDQARSRAYQWGEDGLAGLCDEKMQLCLALALWNGKDPILKERLFGLTNSEGNHGEDVKEYYFYLDSTPTHSYMRMLYKYPQAAFPYDQLVTKNRERGRQQPEYELLDTGIFDDDRYFDVFVEYAKEDPENILIRINAVNQGPQTAVLHILPQLWFRNTWWRDRSAPKPCLCASKADNNFAVVVADHPSLGSYRLYCEGSPELLFTENETNDERIFGRKNAGPYVKDGINNFIVEGRSECVNPAAKGTKMAAHYVAEIKPGKPQTFDLRLSMGAGVTSGHEFGKHFDATLATRRREADEFFTTLAPAGVGDEELRVMRQGFAGLLWGKQTYIYDLDQWLEDRAADPYRPERANVRNREWFHMLNEDVISMPDKWEYPWFASWDLAFHAVALAFIDPDFASQQLDLMLRERYLHPNGQIPAYEWNFGDVNPPVHPWAAWFNYQFCREQTGTNAREGLRTCFNKLLLNFTWWVNRKDRSGRNVFEGGFLGLDNIGVFDRSSPLPTGGYLEQADGSAWMAFFSQNMLQMAIELALESPAYEEMAIKFYEHFAWIAGAMDRVGEHHDEMWDEQDGFYYDVLRFPDGSATRLKVRSMVGLLPLCAVSLYSRDVLERLPRFVERVRWFNRKHPELLANINSPEQEGHSGRYMLSMLSEQKLRRVLRYVFDEREFLSEYGIRSLSRFHLDNPYLFNCAGQEYRVGYVPGDSDSGMFGGNSNWRGPIWMPVNFMIVRSLLQLYSYYGDAFRIEFPTDSGRELTLFEIAYEISRRLIKIFLPGQNGVRPVFGSAVKFQHDPAWRDNLLFYEYFHGDSGAGIGASHQTGWTALVSAIICYFGRVTSQKVLSNGAAAAVMQTAK